MRIYFERSGGFMGKRDSCVVDTESLPKDEAVALREMVTAASFFELPESSSEGRSSSEGWSSAEGRSSSEVPDQFQYKLVVEAEQVKYTVETIDTAVPDSLWPLLRRLTLMTRSQRGSTPSPPYAPD